MTPKQQRFVEEYLIDLNATQAAIRAGYSARTANEQGARLLANVSVRSAIADAKTKRSEETQVNAAWLLARLAQESVADLADLYDERGNVKPVKDWPLIWRQGLVAGIEVETIGAGAGVVTKLKISDRIKRLELIGKHIDVQAFKEKVEHTGAMTLVIDSKDAAL
ncbi:terminase small subunit [Sphingobium sp.]|uniref:terminase small subunit n=1 Tax=Sphingobium sp. TaxID=1912891 RepID=UPI0035C6CB47